MVKPDQTPEKKSPMNSDDTGRSASTANDRNLSRKKIKELLGFYNDEDIDYEEEERLEREYYEGT